VDGARKINAPDVVLGEDWIGPHATADSELRAKRERRGLISINRSPLARKIITFNLLAIVVLVAGVLFLTPFRDSLVFQRELGLVNEAQLIAEVFEALLPDEAPVSLSEGEVDIVGTLLDLNLPSAVEVFVYNAAGDLIASTGGLVVLAIACYRALDRALREAIAVRSQQPTLGQSQQDLAALLRDAGVADNTIRTIRSLLQEVEEAQYAPPAQRPQQMARAVARAQAVVASLQA